MSQDTAWQLLLLFAAVGLALAACALADNPEPRRWQRLLVAATFMAGSIGLAYVAGTVRVHP
jgi:hypothetical protein